MKKQWIGPCDPKEADLPTIINPQTAYELNLDCAYMNGYFNDDWAWDIVDQDSGIIIWSAEKHMPLKKPNGTERSSHETYTYAACQSVDKK